MDKKLLTLGRVLSKKLKDKDFKRYYEEEDKKLPLGLKIAKLRQKSNLTQKQLARKIHTSQTAISRIEQGDYASYSLRTLQKIASATGHKINIDFK